MAEEPTPQYSRELLQDNASRLAHKEELSKEKIRDKRLIETDDGKKELAMKWMDKANLGEAGKKAVLVEIGVDIGMNSAEFIKQVAKWQEENGLAGPWKWDGIIGWKTLEVADNIITEKYDTEQYDNDWDRSSDKWRVADIDTDERETQEINAKKIEKENANREQLNELERKAKSTDSADHEGDTRDPDWKSLTYDDKQKKWVGNEDETTGKVLNTETGKYEESEDKEKAQIDQLITSIKASAEAEDSREYIEGYVNELPGDSLSEVQMNDLNDALNPKGYNIVDATPLYALEDYKKWPILDPTDGNNIVYQNGKLFQSNGNNWMREVYDNGNKDSNNLSRRFTLTPWSPRFDIGKDFQVMSYSDASNLIKNQKVNKTPATSMGITQQNYLYIPSTLVDVNKYPIQKNTEKST